MLPRITIRRYWSEGRYMWIVTNCRCYGGPLHSHKRHWVESAWAIIAHAQDWHDRRHPNPSPAGITNDEAVRMYGHPATESIN